MLDLVIVRTNTGPQEEGLVRYTKAVNADPSQHQAVAGEKAKRCKRKMNPNDQTRQSARDIRPSWALKNKFGRAKRSDLKTTCMMVAARLFLLCLLLVACLQLSEQKRRKRQADSSESESSSSDSSSQEASSPSSPDPAKRALNSRAWKNLIKKRDVETNWRKQRAADAEDP
ncbi:hypothetical protein BaRGS_00026004 [Batillaria attramentaria]|uniref:Uncharacterized protein n=1 Tax=Batillaria attramentaria TaxID=370345 RepID=A0ABD0K5U4_9CAEN